MTKQLREYNRVFYLPMFVISALSIVGCGFLVTSEVGWNEVVGISLLASCGVLWVYSINIFEIRHIRRSKWAWVPIAAILILLATSEWQGWLSPVRWYVLSLILLLGLVYSFPFRINNRRRRVKDIAFLKNLCIGLGWGLLVFLATRSEVNSTLFSIAIFTATQIMIGSAVRDIYDVELDTKEGIRTIPIALGIKTSKAVFQVANVASVVVASYWANDFNVVIAFAIAATLRAVVIAFSTSRQAYFWTQPANILGTTVLFLAMYICL